MSSNYSIFWGDTHHNTYMGSRQDPPLGQVLDFASRHLDFYSAAYYTPIFSRGEMLPEAAGTAPPVGGHPLQQVGAQPWRGVGLEDVKPPDVLKREWAEVQQIMADANRPGSFVTFPGYEWQGNGRWGDHNVILFQEGEEIFTPPHLPELYEWLRGRRGLAIPHHTAYMAPQRAPQWKHTDERLSPFAEMYSLHGCSETDEEWIGLRNNAHMGPGVGGSTYQDALDMGLHLGAICSSDNWKNMPCQWNHGAMACLAGELSREGLWEAFCARRVYGVTGDRIELDFTCNGQPMGSILGKCKTRRLAVSVRGQDAIDRIEILRNGRVIATHCHQSSWQWPRGDGQAKFKLRVEAGWGPKLGEIPMPPRQWIGELGVEGGRMVGWSPAWISRGQGVPVIEGASARFEMLSQQEQVGLPSQNATIFEFQAAPSARLTLSLNGMTVSEPVSAFAARSRLLWYYDECVKLVEQTTGVTPATARRGDVYFHMANKAKLHRAIPEAAYTAKMEIDDDEPLAVPAHYRVRVEQRNGQRAWSSPIWVE